MPSIDLGEIIAERTLTISGEDRELIVQLGKPQRVADGDHFRCPFIIVGVEDERVKYAPGSDAFQALMHALRMIGVEVELRNRSYGGRLRWYGNTGDNLGFPEG